MTIIVYQCTVCDRQVDLQEQPRGLEVINRCIITDECRGTLYKVERKEDFVVGNFPDEVAGLTNYIQRRALYNQEQSIAESSWLITHNLGVNPSVQVIVDRTEEVDGVIQEFRVEVEPQRIEIIDANSLRVFFDRPETGLVQCIARASAPDRLTNAVETTLGTVTEGDTYLQISNGGVITIATDETSGQFGSPQLPIASTASVQLRYISDSQATEIESANTIDVNYDALHPPVSSSPWNDANVVYVDGQQYAIRTIAYGDPVNDSGVTNGTTVFFEQTQAENIRVLIAAAPFDNVDKNLRQFFRPSFLQGPQQVLESVIFVDGEFFINTNVIEDVFPPIYIVS